jgi:ABC-type multidrug transport system ATPase subunit
MLVQDVLRIASWVSPVGNSEREEKWLTESLEFDPTNAFKRVSNLSGGNKRKLCMMFALFGDPALRLLDECSTGLDPASRLAMVDTLKSSSTGTTVFTTHSMSEAEDLCTKAVIMSKGRVLEFDLIGKMRTRHFDCFWVQVELQEQAWSGLASEL